MSLFLLVVLIVLLLVGGGGVVGHRSGYLTDRGLLTIAVVVVLVMALLGAFGRWR